MLGRNVGLKNLDSNLDFIGFAGPGESHSAGVVVRGPEIPTAAEPISTRTNGLPISVNRHLPPKADYHACANIQDDGFQRIRIDLYRNAILAPADAEPCWDENLPLFAG